MIVDSRYQIVGVEYAVLIEDIEVIVEIVVQRGI